MGEPTQSPENTAKAAKAPAAKVKTVEPGKAVELTAAEAAKVVFREVLIPDEAGTMQQAVTADEVFAWSLRGDTVTVVTTDGQKLVGQL